MKAIVVSEPNKIEIMELPKPVITEPDEVIVKIISGGICGSDIGIYKGTNSLASYPRIIGHELGGIVESVGEKVTKVKPGDLIAVDPVVSCGHCYACRTNNHNVCSTVEVIGVHRDGGFAEYLKVSESNCFLIRDKSFDPKLVCLVEPYSIGVEVNERGKISEGDKVLVMGSGPIGVCAMQVAVDRGATVMMTDIVEGRLDLAKKMGAAAVVNIARNDLEVAAEKFTDHEGFSVVVDSVCSPQSFELALKMASPAGRVVVLGTGNKPSSIAEVDLTKKGLTVLGSRLNNYRFPDVISLFENKRVNPEMLNTHQFDFNDVVKAIDTIRDFPEDVCKVVLTFNN